MSDQSNQNEPSWLQRVRWPLALAALLVGHSLLLLVALMASGMNRGGAVTESGYEAAIGWDERQAEKRRGEQLGWSIAMQPEGKARVNGDRAVVFRLFGRGDLPIEDATLEVRLYHHSRADEVTELSPEAVSPGVYESLIPMRHEGLYRIDAVAQTDQERCRFQFDYWLGKQAGDES